jgi:hypothetical protein
MGVCLLHDNPRPPNLVPSDFHVFGPLKDALSGTQFQDDGEVRSAVHEWLRTSPKEFFSCGIYVLVKRWRRCIEVEGDDVEQ